MKNTLRLASCLALFAASSVTAQSVEPFAYGPVEIRDERAASASAPAPSEDLETTSNNGFGAARYRAPGHVRQSAPDWRVRGVDARPATQSLSLNSVIQVPRDARTGHFIMPVLLNGVSVPVIIDTGASMTFLSPDAARITGASEQTTHTRAMVGIGGAANLHITRIDRFSIAGVDMGGFEAAISEKGLPYTLLGQSEIRKLGRIVIEGDVLTISPAVR